MHSMSVLNFTATHPIADDASMAKNANNMAYLFLEIGMSQVKMGIL